jgi:hypothetical protein
MAVQAADSQEHSHDSSHKHLPDKLSGAIVSTEVAVELWHQADSFIGRPLAWDGRQLGMLTRDGKIIFVPADRSSKIESLPDGFQPFTQIKFRQQLKSEFGNRYLLTPTKHFVVVHPPGKSALWADPFEILYRQIQKYFHDRGFELAQPQFPMVAIILRSRKEFDRFMTNHHTYNAAVNGIYARMTNRLVTYDPEAKVRMRDASWLLSDRTVVHEVAHQVAFNIGVHSRYSPPARWAAEGLAMMFEAPGVYYSELYPNLQDRVNQTRLNDFRKLDAAKKISGKLSLLITDDRIFESDPAVANTLAWALTFYLAESNPEAYFEYLKNDSRRNYFEAYAAPARLEDFAKAFGADLEEIESEMHGFLAELPKKK